MADLDHIRDLASHVPALCDEVERLRRSVDEFWGLEVGRLVADRNHHAAVADRLQQWKREALTVLDEWEKVWDDLAQPGSLGQSKAAITREWVQAYKADALRLAERLNAVRTLADEWEGDASFIESNFLPGPNSNAATTELREHAAKVRAALDEHLGGNQ